MSRYSGRQARGAARRAREQRRREAEARNALTPPLRRRIARTGCPTGKKKFDVEVDAWTALGEHIVARTKGANRQERRVYDCDLCTGWHLTSQTPKVRAASFLRWLRRRGRNRPEVAA